MSHEGGGVRRAVFKFDSLPGVQLGEACFCLKSLVALEGFVAGIEQTLAEQIAM